MLVKRHVFSSSRSALRICGLLSEELLGILSTPGTRFPSTKIAKPHSSQQDMLEVASNGLRSCILSSLSKSVEYFPQVPGIVEQSQIRISSISSGAWKKLLYRRALCCSSKHERREKNDLDVLAHDGVSSCLMEPIFPKEDCRPGYSQKQGFPAIGSGGLHLILGPMFAGKTTALLRRIQAEADAGRIVTLAKSDKDTRYGISAVVSHDGIQMPCMAVSDLRTFKEKLGNLYSEVEVIGIDEAQFFKDLVEFCKAAADLDGKTVIVAGLDGDFLRRKFGFAIDLIPLADTVTKLSSRCELCGHPAAFTVRKTQDMEKELIGGAEVYMPVCRHHYILEEMAIKSASFAQEELRVNAM